MRIARLQICHEGTFWALVAAAHDAVEHCLSYRGSYWEPVECWGGLAVYRRYPYDLAWLQERVEQYELVLYSQLLSGHFGPDGVLRPHVHVSRGTSGAYRAAPAAARSMARFQGGMHGDR